MIMNNNRLFLHFLAMLLLLVVSAYANTLFFQPEFDLVCPDNKHSCNAETTCCPLPDGEYGCCMYPNAVCCEDNIHCCQKGSYCDVKNGSCNKDGVKTKWSKKIPAALHIPKEKQMKNQQSWVEKIPPINTMDKEFQQPNSIPWAEKLPGLKINSLNMSSLHTVASCSGVQTLCKSDTGLSGCCPFPNAVCCDKGQFCCPSGFQCNWKTSKCEKPAEETSMKMTSFLRTVSPLTEPFICPDGLTECPKGTTCCLVGSGSYACCPFAKATCCSDLKHCCPNGYTCDITGNQCLKKKVNMILVKMIKWQMNHVCPDRRTTCHDQSTCCPLKGGTYGCCPYPQATCCSDGKHCCPQGYICDLSIGRCRSSSSDIQLPVKDQIIVCPDKRSVCTASHTCCKLRDGTYGCCPYPKATCCIDRVHCCPHDYKCDNIHKKCIKKVLGSQQSFLTSAIQSSDSILCPDKTTKCRFGSNYQCCPIPKAVCCQDNKHCCPTNYHCDLEHSRCVMGQTSLPLFKKFLPSTSLTALKAPQKNVNYVLCPDDSECPDRNTCCLMDTGAWGCCPYLKAVCCNDRKHCCPNGYFCDMKLSKCAPSKSSVNPFVSMVYSHFKYP